MRVYRNDPTIIDLPDGEEGNYYLRPPAIEKNFLISPPGSPPVGWEQIREDPPNATPLATDLMAALNKLHLQQGPLNESGFEVLIEPDEGETGIGIYVEDCDHRRTKDEPAERDWVYGQPSPGRPMWKPAPTAMPAMRVGA
ncbi:hypothetical protein EUX98_g3374 [Antrodiella citrinella]|uniref:Uncharacterized protein n=1 Tax=Antrodiella citrinella TaxID=2447956 RepID=A0A4S4MWQ2_9APHY|nr:hypothetical protein EUX98_g3374 [Antrodiella citrinella]